MVARRRQRGLVSEGTRFDSSRRSGIPASSEIEMLVQVDEWLKESQRLRATNMYRADALVHMARRLIESMMEQVRAGVHVNPSLVVFGLNNPRGQRSTERGQRDPLLSNDVLAVVYRHEHDDQCYVHGFGDAEIELSMRGDRLTIDGLKERTRVCMRGRENGERIEIYSQDGRAVWENFDDQRGAKT